MSVNLMWVQTTIPIIHSLFRITCGMGSCNKQTSNIFHLVESLVTCHNNVDSFTALLLASSGKCKLQHQFPVMTQTEPSKFQIFNPYWYRWSPKKSSLNFIAVKNSGSIAFQQFFFLLMFITCNYTFRLHWKIWHAHTSLLSIRK
jgi:hypothetical protein